MTQHNRLQLVVDDAKAFALAARGRVAVDELVAVPGAVVAATNAAARQPTRVLQKAIAACTASQANGTHRECMCVCVCVCVCMCVCVKDRHVHNVYTRTQKTKKTSDAAQQTCWLQTQRGTSTYVCTRPLCDDSQPCACAPVGTGTRACLECDGHSHRNTTTTATAAAAHR